jgi:hypothetical protein
MLNWALKFWRNDRFYFPACGVAILLGFAAIMVSLPPPSAERPLGSSQTTNNISKENCSVDEWIVRCAARMSVDWIGADEHVTAISTAFIAIFTATIWGINRAQLRHSHQVERAYISGGGVPQTEVITTQSSFGSSVPGGLRFIVPPVRRLTGNFDLHVNNYGKTPGELLRYGIGFSDTGALPQHPIYTWNFFRDWIAPGVGSRTLVSIPIPQGLSDPAVYGRFLYRDIFGKCHSSGFTLRLRSDGLSESISSPSREYTDERDEPDET